MLEKARFRAAGDAATERGRRVEMKLMVASGVWSRVKLGSAQVFSLGTAFWRARRVAFSEIRIYEWVQDVHGSYTLPLARNEHRGDEVIEKRSERRSSAMAS